jgi:multicomponent Na+:H+ antiporter subunit F
MDEFLLSAAAFVLLMVALGLVRVARGPGYADRMMAAQLLGTGGIATLLLVGVAVGEAAVVDVALTLALLAAFTSIAFVKFMAHKDRPPDHDHPRSAFGAPPQGGDARGPAEPDPQRPLDDAGFPVVRRSDQHG